MNYIKRNWLVLLILAVLVIIFILVHVKSCSNDRADRQDAENVINYLQDSTRFWKNEAGMATASLRQLSLSNEKAVMDIESKDLRIKELQRAYSEVREQLKKRDKILSITLLKLESKIKGTFDSILITDVDTIYTDTGCVIIIQPQYRFNKGDEWHTLEGAIGATPENSFYHLTTKESLQMSYIERKRGFLGIKGREYVLQATSLSPYTTSIDLNGFTIKEKPKRFHVVVAAGYGLNEKGLGFNLGLGVGYSIFSF